MLGSHHQKISHLSEIYQPSYLHSVLHYIPAPEEGFVLSVPGQGLQPNWHHVRTHADMFKILSWQKYFLYFHLFCDCQDVHCWVVCAHALEPRLRLLFYVIISWKIRGICRNCDVVWVWSDWRNGENVSVLSHVNGESSSSGFYRQDFLKYLLRHLMFSFVGHKSTSGLSPD